MDAILRKASAVTKRHSMRASRPSQPQPEQLHDRAHEGPPSNAGVIPFNAWNIKEIGQDGALKQLSKSELLFRLAGLNTFSDADSDGDSDGGSSSELQLEQAPAPEQQHVRAYSSQVPGSQGTPPEPIARDRAQTDDPQQSYAQACRRPAAIPVPVAPPLGAPPRQLPLSPSLRYANSAYTDSSAAQPARERLPSVGSVPSELSDEDDFDICDNDNDIGAGDDGDDGDDSATCMSIAGSSAVSSPTMGAAADSEPGSGPGAATVEPGFDLGASWCVAAAQAQAHVSAQTQARARSSHAVTVTVTGSGEEEEEQQQQGALQHVDDIDWAVVGQ